MIMTMAGQQRNLMWLLGRLVFLLVSLRPGVCVELQEDDRHAEYLKRNYTWPLTAVNPNTDGWQRLMLRRLAQVERIEDDDKRYNGFMTTMASAISAPNFTQSGWGLTRAPPDILHELQDSLEAGRSTAYEEDYVDVIEGANRPLFIDQHPLNEKVLNALRPMHEAWAGVPLVGSVAYGLRIYQNNSRLLMHIDQPDTHVISCILHVGHSEDSEPWPLFIEDFQGNTNEVLLEPGDMLFYESSKCLHGRPRRFNGSWYSSLFVHYHPLDWDVETASLEAHYAIPPHWSTPEPPDDQWDELDIVGASLKEPTCPDEWCATKNTVKWHGPAIDGQVMSTKIHYDDTDHGTGTSEEL